MGEGRRPWWVPGNQLTSRDIYIYLYTSTNTIKERRKEAYIGKVASWGQAGLEMG